MRRVVLLVFFWLWLLPMQAVFGQTIIGRVFDHASGTPIADVAVTLFDRTGQLSAGVISDSSGYFRLNPSTGVYSLLVDAAGYESVARTVEVLSNQRIEIDVRVTREVVQLELVTVSAEALPFAPVHCGDSTSDAIAAGDAISPARKSSGAIQVHSPRRCG